MKSVDITHISNVWKVIQDPKKQLPMLGMKLEHYSINLGIPWLQLHDLAVQSASNMITFRSQYGITHCHEASAKVLGDMEEPPEPLYPKVEGIFNPLMQPQ